MRLVTRNFNRPTVSSFPSLWNDLFADDFFIKQAIRDKNTCKTTAKSRNNNNTPAVNIKDKKGHYFIEVAAPGFKKSDFLVEVEDNTLTISTRKVEKEASPSELETGAAEEGEKIEKGTYTHQEFAKAPFKRTFTISEKLVDVEKIEASYEAGVLVISIPKKEVEETKLNIDVL
jgi:HSP20 family protein